MDSFQPFDLFTFLLLPCQGIAIASLKFNIRKKRELQKLRSGGTQSNSASSRLKAGFSKMPASPVIPLSRSGPEIRRTRPCADPGVWPHDCPRIEQ